MEEFKNEVAIIFIAKKVEDDDYFELIPQRVEEGLFDFFDEKFINMEGKEYQHFINIDGKNNLFPCFGFNYSIKNYLSKFPNCSYNNIFDMVLNELNKYTFFCNYNNNITNILVTNIETNNITYITDNLCDELNHIVLKYGENATINNDNNLIDVDKSEANNSNLNYENNQNFEYKINTKGLYEKLKEYIIGQDKPLETIVGTIWKNYNSDSSATNILVAGPTGVGKTETARIISSYINVPIVIVGANDFSQVGYVGDNTKDILKNLLTVANGDVKKAERGIVILDELDKLAFRQNDRNDVATKAVQYELLKLIEDGTYFVEGKTISTKNITFLACGAFEGININNSKHVGFNKDIITSESKKYSDITFKDIEKYGIARQLLGRLPLLVFYSDLSIDNYYHIMTEAKGSEMLNFISVFEKYNKELIFEDDTIIEIAKRAKELNLGARSISTIINNVMQCINFDMSQDLIDKNKIIVTPETVLNPKKYILR